MSQAKGRLEQVARLALHDDHPVAGVEPAA
jgi:hypothetical protein